MRRSTSTRSRVFVVAGDPELLERPVPDVPCWLECPADHPHAVPFWKDDRFA